MTRLHPLVGAKLGTMRIQFGEGPIPQKVATAHGVLSYHGGSSYRRRKPDYVTELGLVLLSEVPPGSHTEGKKVYAVYPRLPDGTPIDATAAEAPEVSVGARDLRLSSAPPCRTWIAKAC